MASLVAKIPPQTVDVLDRNGKITQPWWLFLLNLSQSLLGSQGNSPTTTIVQTSLDVDSDADTSDATTYPQAISNVQALLSDELVIPPAQTLFIDDDLPIPAPRAQAVQLPTVGASPWTFTALFDGVAVISGGTVSALSLSRDGTNFYAVPSAVPMARLDQLKVTFSAAPALAFFPR